MQKKIYTINPITAQQQMKDFNFFIVEKVINEQEILDIVSVMKHNLIEKRKEFFFNIAYSKFCSFVYHNTNN